MTYSTKEIRENNKSNFIKSMKQEQIISDKLDKTVMPYLANRIKLPVERVYDRKMQLNGADYIIPYHENKVRIDMKAEVKQYINDPTNTSALELSGLGDYGGIGNGWLFTKSTEYYMFMWIFKAQNKFGTYITDEGESINTKVILNPDDIEIFDVIFVRHKDVIDFLKRKNLPWQKIWKLDKFITELKNPIYKENKYGKKLVVMYYHPQTDKFDYIWSPRAVEFTRSDDYQEHPVNIVISKYIWDNLSRMHLLVDHGRVCELKKGEFKTLGLTNKDDFGKLYKKEIILPKIERAL